MGPSVRDILIGSEGVFGIITELTLRIWRLPELRLGVVLAFPSLPWGMPADDHVAAVAIYNAEALRLIAPLGRLRQHQPWIADGSMQLIESRARDRRLLDESRAEASRQTTRACLALWAVACWPWCA